jgi:hypothetical protein
VRCRHQPQTKQRERRDVGTMLDRQASGNGYWQQKVMNRTNRAGFTMYVFEVDRKWLAEGQNGAFDPLRVWAALTASAINLRIVPCPPLDVRRLPTFNWAADRDRLRLDALEKRTGSSSATVKKG